VGAEESVAGFVGLGMLQSPTLLLELILIIPVPFGADGGAMDGVGAPACVGAGGAMDGIEAPACADSGAGGAIDGIGAPA